jgi:hypothetical protein
LKKVVSILLIFAFLLQSTSQLWIMAAFKINQDYIAANLCINRFDEIPVCKGSCYLEKQLNQDQKQQQKFPDLKTKEINLFCQDNTTGLPTQVVILNNNISYPKFNTSFITSAYLRSVFRPPSLIV